MKLKQVFNHHKHEEEQQIEIIKNSEFFDTKWYLEKNPDVKSRKMSAARHYLKNGWKENRNPSPKFSTREYLKKYPECKICPLVFEYNRNSFVDLAICAIMKNEGPYVKEWIDYHRLVGVKRFYIYDNESTDNMKEILTPYIESGIVVYKYFPGQAMQLPAYNECLKDYRDKMQWLAVIDADEFIVPKKYNTIIDFLKEYEDYPAIGIAWQMFDSNGHKERPKGGVLENFTRVHFSDSKVTMLKSIVQPQYVREMSVHRHKLVNGEYTINENKKRYFSDKIIDSSRTSIQINHYYTKSYDEFVIRCKKGNAYTGASTRKIHRRNYEFQFYKYDYSVYKYVIRLYPNKLLKETCYKFYLICANMYWKLKNARSCIEYYIDDKWYKNQYEEAQKSDMSAIEHFMTVGWKKGYNPSLKFDTKFYLNKYPSVKNAGLNPLEHYIEYGQFEGRLPKPNIIKKDKERYKAHKGDYELCKSSEYFDLKYYLLHNPKLLFTHQDPVEHYLTVGWKEGKNPSSLFDTNFYLEKYQDVKRMGINPLVHYLRNGQKEGRIASNTVSLKPLYDSYMRKFKAHHIVTHSKLFDKKWYKKTYKDVASSQLSPVEHYLTIGWKKGYNPSQNFDTNAYLERYKDVARAGVNPLVHYLKSGIKENRVISKIQECAFIIQEPNRYDRYICSKKEKNPLISVIVTSYNYADLITKTLDGLVAQTYKNFEVIVVDDGSKDNSVKVIKKYVKQYPFIQLHRHSQGKNKGLPETVRLGIEKAKGKYIAFCESDDYWTPNHLEEKVKIINNYANPKIIVNDVELFGDTKKCKSVQAAVDERKYHLNKTKNTISVTEFRDKNWIVTLSCCMIKKSVLDKCDITGTPRGANLDWWIYRQVCCGNKIFYVNQKLTYWNMHESYMHTEMKDGVTAMMKQELFIKNMDKLLLKKHPLRAIKLLNHIEKEDREYKVNKGKLYHYRKISKYQPSFSIIMPTFNRAFLLESTVNSVLGQTYQNFELIIVDDGSTDGTKQFIKEHYATEIKSGKIKYIYKENSGVCKTRNIGLKNATNEWIAYCDSDNFMAPQCLERFACAILEHPKYKTFYANLISINSKRQIGHRFNYNKLLEQNYIDLGVFVHHRSVYEKLGGFDENMTRLVDWDLIARYTKEYEPYYFNKTVLYYNDADDYNRITNSAKLYDNMAYFRKKNCHVPTVTTMITSYNHQDYIREAIESAIKQMGNFVHEIIISDDGSTDETPQIIQEYAEKYPHLIRNISECKNIGISANMKKCFEAATGKYIAVLEGDDYWINNFKLEKQKNFLKKHKDCSMVFSKLKILTETTQKFSYLPRQANLPTKISGDDVIKEETLNLIGNFSCCMFRKENIINLPDSMYKTRLNEIAISFYMVQKGKIGFIATPLSVYRMREDSVWTGANRVNKLRQGLDCRKMALAVCENKYKKPLQKIIDEQYIKPLNELEEKEQQTKEAV